MVLFKTTESTFQHQRLLAFPLQRLQDYVKRLGRHDSAGLIGILVINYNFFGKDPFERVLAFPTGNQVEDGDLALLQSPAADLIRTVDVNSSLDVTLVVLHERSAVYDDGALAGQVTLAALGHLLRQVIGVDDLDAG